MKGFQVNEPVWILQTMIASIIYSLFLIKKPLPKVTQLGPQYWSFCLTENDFVFFDYN